MNAVVEKIVQKSVRSVRQQIASVNTVVVPKAQIVNADKSSSLNLLGRASTNSPYWLIALVIFCA